MTYRAPLKDMLFVMNELAGLESISQLPGYEDATPDTAQAVLEEAAKFNEQVVAPLNRAGDLNPSSWKDGVVTTTPASATHSASLVKAAGRACCIRPNSAARVCRSWWPRRATRC
jgi:hypothetical protein